jgi:hypothetical protein
LHATFVKRLQVIKSTFYSIITHQADDQDMIVGESLNDNDLDYQQGMFKLIMNSNTTTCMAPPFDWNPLIKL